MESVDWHNARALLSWQIELGADECIADTPIDRYVLEAKVAAPKAKAAGGGKAAPPIPRAAPDAAVIAQTVAAAARDLTELQDALASFDLCPLKQGARNMVFSDGDSDARVMVIGGVPDRDEDRAGKPFVGRDGALFDAMFGAIDHGRQQAEKPLYATCALPWRTPQGRAPTKEEIAMLKPFLLRHIALVAPKVVVIMGNIACDVLLGQGRAGQLRGTWGDVQGCAAMPMLHPRNLQGRPQEKRAAWSDLLMIKAKLREQ